MNSQTLIIQDTFLGIPVTGNSIQHPATYYIHFSQFNANKTHSTNSTIMLQGGDSTQPVTVYSNKRHSGFDCTSTVSSAMIMVQPEMPFDTKQKALYSLQY